MARNHSRAWFAALAVVVVATGCKYTGWGHVPSQNTAATARNWIVSQQQADGGFEVAGFAGFETPDAVLAIAEAAQQQYLWDKGQARAAVEAVTKNGNSGLDALDDFAAGPINAGQAAKLIVLVAAPLGLDPNAFDPGADGAPVNLVGAVNAGAAADGSYGAFNATLYAAIAKRLTQDSVPANTVSVIRAGQESTGGWGYTGDPTAADADADTTSLAIQALVAARVSPTDVDLTEGLAYLATTQAASGAWTAYGAADPNSTAVGIVAVTAAGEDPTKACWRNRVAPGRSGQPYTSPVGWLVAQAAPDGHIASPNDAFPPVNTFATSQSVQALRRGWLPVVAQELRPC